MASVFASTMLNQSWLDDLVGEGSRAQNLVDLY